MAINFIKKIVDNDVDDYTHLKFTRFGKGKFEKEDFIVKLSGKNVQIQTGYEYAEVILRILAENTNSEVVGSGKIISSKDVEDKIKEHGLEITAKRGKKYDVKFSLSSSDFKKFIYDFEDCYVLLNATSGLNVIKMKQSLPKPNKLVEKFINAKYDKDLLPVLTDEFLFDVPNFKKQVTMKHWYEINDIVVDEELVKTDPLKARLEAKRKGKLIREINLDGNKESKEYAFDV